MKISIPYGRGKMEADVPDCDLQGVFTSSLPEPEMCGADYVRQALDAPIASPRLEDLAKGKRTAVVITSDHTRPVPSRVIMPQILARLRLGNPALSITILVATGFHRATTREELVAKLGEDIVADEKIIVHDSGDATALTDAGTLPSGGRLLVNRLVMEADLVVAEGFIEPHFFAGFSGGRKSILPGVVSRETVMANHCAEFIASPLARTGNLDGNPIHRDMLFAAKTAKLAFIVNVVINARKEIVHAVAGDCEQAHAAGCAWLKDICQVNVPVSDIVVTSNGGYPLDQNLYQSPKAVATAEACCKDGGVIIMCCSCCDGMGGTNFEKLIVKGTVDEIDAYLSKIPAKESISEQWCAQIYSRILKKHRVILVTTYLDHDLVRKANMIPASTPDEALEMAYEMMGRDAQVVVIPDGVSVLAVKEDA